MPYKDPEQQRIAQRESYLRNREASAERGKERQKEKYRRLRAIKEASPCADCNKNYPYYVMQFDHVGTNKIANVGKLVRSAGWDTVLKEISKCELVCANCHAVRTWERLQHQPKGT